MVFIRMFDCGHLALMEPHHVDQRMFTCCLKDQYIVIEFPGYQFFLQHFLVKSFSLFGPHL